MAVSKNPKLDIAVIAAAGAGTRLLPLTLHQPKAMAAVADRPLIHYVVDQIAAGGIREFVIVINPGFQSVRRYIQYQLKREWRHLRVTVVEKKSVDFADSIMAARRYVGGRYFIAAACDDLIDDNPPPFAAFRGLFAKHGKPMVMLRQIARKDSVHYGVIEGEPVAKDVWRVYDITEKPAPKDATSSLGAIGEYILPPDIFRLIVLTRKQTGGEKEVSVVDVLKLHLAVGGDLLGWVFRGAHFDGGSKLGLLKALLYFGARHPELGKSFTKHLRSL